MRRTCVLVTRCTSVLALSSIQPLPDGRHSIPVAVEKMSLVAVAVAVRVRAEVTVANEMDQSGRIAQNYQWQAFLPVEKTSVVDVRVRIAVFVETSVIVDAASVCVTSCRQPVYPGGYQHQISPVRVVVIVPVVTREAVTVLVRVLTSVEPGRVVVTKGEVVSLSSAIGQVKKPTCRLRLA